MVSFVLDQLQHSVLVKNIFKGSWDWTDSLSIICQTSSTENLTRQLKQQLRPLKHFPSSSHGEDWQPLTIYRNSLVFGEGEAPPAPAKRPYTRKRKVDDDDEDDDDEDY